MIRLQDISRTEALGKWLAENLAEYGSPALLLNGDLGSGKTYLICQIVESMPGGEDAEASSPSFTICNSYPTQPPSLHCDLYRCHALPEDVAELIRQGGIQIFVEWAEFLRAEAKPDEYLEITITGSNETRFLDIKARGKQASSLLEALLKAWGES